MTTFRSRWGKLGPQRQLALPIGPPEPLASARPIGSSAHWNQPAEHWRPCQAGGAAGWGPEGRLAGRGHLRRALPRAPPGPAAPGTASGLQTADPTPRWVRRRANLYHGQPVW